jgi:hypothetical protein
LACEQNFAADFDATGDHNFVGRLFPFTLLWASTRPKEYDRGLFVERDVSKDPNARYSLGSLIFEKLLKPFSAQAATREDKVLFERICYVCSFMCAHDPQDRKIDPKSPLSASQQCLDFLENRHAQLQRPSIDLEPSGVVFGPVCKFIDNFCASGHYRGTARVLRRTDRWRQVQFQIAGQLSARTADYHQSSKPGQSWLFVFRENDPIPRNDFQAMTYANCLTPDYCVLPAPAQVHSAVAAQPRAIFLPRNKFCCGADSSVPGMFDVERLALLTQRDWFTVFRYEKPGQPSWIVKLAVLFYLVCCNLAFVAKVVPDILL